MLHSGVSKFFSCAGWTIGVQEGISDFDGTVSNRGVASLLMALLAYLKVSLVLVEKRSSSFLYWSCWYGFPSEKVSSILLVLQLSLAGTPD